VWGKGNLDALDELIAADAVDHGLPPGLPPGREGIKTYLSMLLSAFPGTQMTIEDQIAEGTKWLPAGRQRARTQVN
jgi:hypothetical protein